MEKEINGDMLYEIMLRSDIEEIQKLCRINKEANKIGRQENFWQTKYLAEFTPPSYPVHKWKKEYQMKYIVNHPKRIFKLVYTCRDDSDTILMMKVKHRREAYKYLAYLCNNELIAERYISKLVRQYDDPDFQIEESQELKTLCQEYYNGHKFKYHGMQSTIDICKRFYLKPNYLYYYLGNDTYSINSYLNLFKYLYSKQFSIELFSDPYPTTIPRPYFTTCEIEMMLQLDPENSDGDIVELVTDEYF